MSNPTALVQKLSNYCNILPSSLRYDATNRDGGLSFCLRQSILQKAFTGELATAEVSD